MSENNKRFYFSFREVGMGDCLTLSSCLDSTTPKDENWTISLNEHNLNYRLNSNYVNYIGDFLNFLYPHRKVKMYGSTIESSPKFTELNVQTFCSQNTVFPDPSYFLNRFLGISNELIENGSLVKNQYVVVPTRNRLNKSITVDLLLKFVDLLNNSNKKVVLVGEKENTQFYEGDNHYKIYDRNLDKQKTVDLTFDTSLNHADGFSSFLYDFSLVANSLMTFSLGCGGFWLVSCCMNKSISFHDRSGTPQFYRYPSYLNRTMFYDANLYLDKVEEVVNYDTSI